MHTLNLNSNARSIVEQYDNLMDWVRSISTVGGTVIGGRGCTFRDAINPVFILTVEGEYEGKNVTTSFLIRKEDLYVVGFNLKRTEQELRNPNNWNLTQECYTKLAGANYTSWSCSYQGVQRNTFLKKDDILVLEKLGKESILKAMYFLHYYPDYASAAFHCIARNFCEGFRFTNVANTVKNGIIKRNGEPVEREDGYDLSDYFRHWSALGKILAHFSRKGYLTCGQWELLATMKIETTDQLKRIMFIIKRENQRAREERRHTEQVTYHTFKHTAKAKSFKEVFVPPSWKVITLVDSPGKKERMQCLFDVWYRDVAASEKQLKQMRADEFHLLKKKGRKDIWDSLEKAFAELEGGKKRYFKSIVDDTDIILLSQYLNKWCDDRGIEYIMDELILCRPHPA